MNWILKPWCLPSIWWAIMSSARHWFCCWWSHIGTFFFFISHNLLLYMVGCCTMFWLIHIKKMKLDFLIMFLKITLQVFPQILKEKSVWYYFCLVVLEKRPEEVSFSLWKLQIIPEDGQRKYQLKCFVNHKNKKELSGSCNSLNVDNPFNSYGEFYA